ncbi:hypothetical protein MyNCGM121_01120 [Achromobacter xylosoxidans]
MAASSATAAALAITGTAGGVAATVNAVGGEAGDAGVAWALTQVLPHTVPDGLLIGEPTLLPYSVHEPS